MPPYPRKIWIDLDNAPHAHFFAPIVRALSLRGFEPLLSVRRFGQTEDLARAYAMHFHAIGSHRALRGTSSRVLETLHRAAQLVEFGSSHRPVAAVSHGSRALTIAATILGIPSMVLYDYEHISSDIFHRLCRRVLVPDVLLHGNENNSRLIGYPGFKEDVYVHDFRPNRDVLAQLQLNPEQLIVTVRPPATWAHYHNEHSTELFHALIERLRHLSNAQVVVLARTREQARDLARDFCLDLPPFTLLSQAVDGLSLICFSDAVFSGGGTMVREAALLGTAAYSTFAGEPGAVDRCLERMGKLTVLATIDDVSRLTLTKKSRHSPPPQFRTRELILQHIVDLATSGASL